MPQPLESTVTSEEEQRKVQAKAKSRGWVDLTKEVSFLKRNPDFVTRYSNIYKGTFRGEEVAIKVMKVVSDKPPTMQRKFLREITAWATLKHVNVVPFYGFTIGTGSFAPIGSLISPWYPNGDAKTFLDERGSQISIKQRLSLWRGVVSGVRYLHENDPMIVHGDLKPSNILIDNKNNPRICDFGLVRIFQEEMGTPLATTTPFTGTERYLAPELIEEAEDAKPTIASDIWALGCVGLELIYSTLPYQHIRATGGHGATFNLFKDIRAGKLPGSPPAKMDQAAQLIWGILAECWRKLPNERLHARTILTLLSGRHALGAWKNGSNMSSVELKGHTKWVSSVAFSPNGKYIASGSGDGTIRLWNTSTGLEVKRTFAGHEDRVLSVAFSPNGNYIVSGAMDQMVMIWSVTTGQRIGEAFKGHIDSVYSVAFSPDGTHVASGSADRTVIIWDVETGRMAKDPFTGHTAAVLSVAFSPDSKRIVSGSWDSMLILWDTLEGEAFILPSPGHTGGILSVVFSADGFCIVSGAEDKTVRIWDAKTGEPVGEPLIGHDLSVHSVAISQDGTCIASGSQDQTVRLWDAITRKPLQQLLKGHSHWVRSIAFSPDGTQIASGSLDDTVRLWNAGSPRL